MSKKILFVIGGSYVSGLEIITLTLLKQLKAQGHQLHCIISGWNDGVFKKKLEEIGVSYDEIKIGWFYLRKPKWTLDTLVHYPGAYAKCRKVMRQFNPDVIHVCVFTVIILLYPLFRKKCVYALHETHLPTFKHRMVYRITNRKVQAFTAVSGHIAKVLKNLSIPEQKIRLIYNGIPVQPPAPKTATSNKTLVFGIIGQVAYWKGHETLVDAVEALSVNNLSFKVFVYGNDKTPFGQNLKQKISAKKLDAYFEFKGFVNAQREIYDHVDVVVVPSLSQEPCSMTIIEAMMYSKAVIASNRGGNPELVTHEKTGLLFDAASAHELAKAMEQLMLDPSAVSKLSGNAYSHASERLTDTRMAAEYIELYNSIVK